MSVVPVPLMLCWPSRIEQRMIKNAKRLRPQTVDTEVNNNSYKTRKLHRFLHQGNVLIMNRKILEICNTNPITATEITGNFRFISSLCSLRNRKQNIYYKLIKETSRKTVAVP